MLWSCTSHRKTVSRSYGASYEFWGELPNWILTDDGHNEHWKFLCLLGSCLACTWKLSLCRLAARYSQRSNSHGYDFSIWRLMLLLFGDIWSCGERYSESPYLLKLLSLCAVNPTCTAPWSSNGMWRNSVVGISALEHLGIFQVQGSGWQWMGWMRDPSGNHIIIIILTPLLQALGFYRVFFAISPKHSAWSLDSSLFLFIFWVLMILRLSIVFCVST